MTDPHADTHIDDALEALARPEPPDDHVGRVLARTGPSGEKDGSLHRRPASASRPPAVALRWALPIAAALLIAASGTSVWRAPTLPAIVADDVRRATDGSPALSGAEGESGPYQAWGALREIDQPVLPPEAYWAMDAFEEWESLRPGAGHRVPGTGSSRFGASAGDRGRGTRNDRADASHLAWVPAPSGLPPIELEPIAPAPLAVMPLPDPSPIELAAITLEPIVIAPLAEEERP